MRLQHGLFRDLFLWMFSRNAPWRDLPPRAQSIFDEVQATYPPFYTDSELEDSLPAESRLEASFSSYLYLEPSVKDRQVMLPIVTASYNFDPEQKSIDKVRVRLGLFFKHQGETKSVAFRFESPEGEGSHNFYHVQPIRALDREPVTPGGADWLPEWNPTLPLDANDPVTLVLCLLMSLYGRDYLDRELQSAPFSSELQKSRLQMRYQQFQPKYWEVRIRSEEQYWKTFASDKSFKLVMRSVHNAADFQEITQRTYYASENDGNRFDF